MGNSDGTQPLNASTRKTPEEPILIRVNPRLTSNLISTRRLSFRPSSVLSSATPWWRRNRSV